MAGITTSSGVVVGCLLGVLLSLTMVEGRRGAEVCEGGRIEGDKWFDGCQWCVCTAYGTNCSRSDCSTGLVHKVPPCHEEKQRWTDGCYRCRCKRRGIECRIDLTCLLLSRNPVPCLADDRCVCGPDGVPSCTAEVIDRRAFSATRVDLGLPTLLPPNSRENLPAHGGGRKRRGKILEALLNEIEEGEEEEESQELLITSDNLCRFGPRWYGGSLRCFCDIDGSITCGNPVFVLEYFDDFKMKGEECEKEHVWEEGCDVCSCGINGVVFCRRDRECRLEAGNLLRENTNKVDFQLPGFEEEEGLVVAPVRVSPTNTPRTKSTARSPVGDCMPGMRWRDGCKRCHCDQRGRISCNRRSCKHDAEGKDVVDDKNDAEEKIRGDREEGGKEDDTTHHKTEKAKDKPKKPHHHKDKDHGRKHHDLEKPKEHRPEDNQETKEEAKEPHKGKSEHHHGNDANETPSVIKPIPTRSSRGPMMVVPKISAVYRPPAYTQYSTHHREPKPCGRFQVGEIFWKDCNLCLCTTKGPKCQGKMCW